MSTYHDILGVNPGASQEELKHAFRRRALECHPDQAEEGEKEEAQREFLRVREAFEALSDTEDGRWTRGPYNGTDSDDGTSGERGRRRSYAERWRSAEKVRVRKDIVDRVQGLSGEYRLIREKNKITIPICAALSTSVFVYDPLTMHGTGLYLLDVLLVGLIGSACGFALGSTWAYLEILFAGSDRG